MSTQRPMTGRSAAIDFMVDENASRVDVPDDSTIRPAAEFEETVGATGPTNWWLYGLVGLSIVVLILLLMQLLGGFPGTDVLPGTPVAEPEIPPAVPTT